MGVRDCAEVNWINELGITKRAIPKPSSTHKKQVLAGTRIELAVVLPNPNVPSPTIDDPRFEIRLTRINADPQIRSPESHQSPVRSRRKLLPSARIAGWSCPMLRVSVHPVECRRSCCKAEYRRRRHRSRQSVPSGLKSEAIRLPSSFPERMSRFD